MTLDLFAVTAPGLEPLAAAELVGLEMEAVRAEQGGVAFRGNLAAVARANLWSRTATRILVRLGDFRARGFNEIEKHGPRIPWERFLGADRAVHLRVTSKKSRLYHTGAIAERLARSIESRAGARAEEAHAEEENEEGTAQLVIVRLFRDRMTLSADSSGMLLHRRGYRQALAKAPMRETLAAALLLAAEWRGESKLLDPLCGSGTIAIEGALIARRLPPGVARRFAFMDWPEFDAGRWEEMRVRALEAALPRAPCPILASDRDDGAIAAAQSNAERAGVAEDIDLRVSPLSAIAQQSGTGHVATNPPYGVRVGERARLRNLYAMLGNVVRQRCPGWILAMITADAALQAQIGIDLQPLIETRNGGIPVRFVRGVVPREGS
ncbi:MAG: class I SAM-dependent RNA methyltransferase [Gemmatimonadota bacterium]|nr:class I SAM-dependent RNA methyltransferase [Gemmatimonadota bacterium]